MGWINGVVEWWSGGVVEWWSIGVLEIFHCESGGSVQLTVSSLSQDLNLNLNL